MMRSDAEDDLIHRLRLRFPSEAKRTDEWVEERGMSSNYFWLEAFADRVTDAVRNRCEKDIEEITGFIAEFYRGGSTSLKEFIDVAFAENLMWDVNKESKVWAWPYIASEIRDLYSDMWGTPGP